MADMSDTSKEWFQKVLLEVQAAYEKYLQANPMDRVVLAPGEPETLKTEAYARVHARASTMRSSRS